MPTYDVAFSGYTVVVCENRDEVHEVLCDMFADGLPEIEIDKITSVVEIN